jgi:hypothetical protein
VSLPEVNEWRRGPAGSVLAGIPHASFPQKNDMTVHHILHAYFTQPSPVYAGPAR